MNVVDRPEGDSTSLCAAPVAVAGGCRKARGGRQ